MKTVSIRDLHIRTSEIVRAVLEDGSPTIIERRGQPVAELRPIQSPPPLSPEPKKRIMDRMRKVRAGMPLMLDSTSLIEEDRNR